MASVMQRTRPALWAATLTALALLRGPPGARAGTGAAGTGPVVRCEPCDARALAQCAPPPAAPACAELVREPGCGCCSVCARLEGEACGVYTPRCAQGLRCYPHPDSELPLQALVQGAGTCEKRRDADYGASSEQVAGNAGPGQLFGRNLEGSGGWWGGAGRVGALGWRAFCRQGGCGRPPETV